MLFYYVKAISLAEKERGAPNTRKTDDRVYDPTDYRHRAAADPGNDVKIEESYASPVESSNHRKNKSYSVHYSHNLIPFQHQRAIFSKYKYRSPTGDLSLPENRVVIIFRRDFSFMRRFFKVFLPFLSKIEQNKFKGVDKPVFL